MVRLTRRKTERWQDKIESLTEKVNGLKSEIQMHMGNPLAKHHMPLLGALETLNEAEVNLRDARLYVKGMS